MSQKLISKMLSGKVVYSDKAVLTVPEENKVAIRHSCTVQNSVEWAQSRLSRRGAARSANGILRCGIS